MTPRSSHIVGLATTLVLIAGNSAQAKIAITSLASQIGNSSSIFLGKALNVDTSKDTASVHVMDVLKAPANGPLPAEITLDGNLLRRGELSQLKDHPSFLLFARKNGDSWGGTMIFIQDDGAVIPALAIRSAGDIRTRDALTAEIKRLMSPEFIAAESKILSDPKADDNARAEAVRTLGDLRAAAAWPALEAYSLNPAYTSSIAPLTEALRALWFIDPKRFTPVALRVIATTPYAWHAQSAASLLAQNPGNDSKTLAILLAAMKRFENDKDYGVDTSDALLQAIGSLGQRNAEVDALVLRKLKENPVGRKGTPITTAADLHLRQAVPLIVDILDTQHDLEARETSAFLGMLLGAASHPGDGTPLDNAKVLEIAARDLPTLKDQLGDAQIINAALQSKVLILGKADKRYIYVGWFPTPTGDATLKAILAYPESQATKP